MAKSKKYYTVWDGHNTGVFDSWAACQKQIKNYPNAKYKSFKSKKEAEDAFYEAYDKHIGNNPTQSKGQKDLASFENVIVKDSISVDAACSGNPGIMEYRGVITDTREEIFHKGPFQNGTNNIGEFLALVHALALFKKLGNKSSIYTDSKTAMAWVRNKKIKTSLQKDSRNAILFNLIERATKWLHENTYENKILKWDTKNWGEIPADFGRK